MHRFSRPSGVKYPLIVEDKLRNYVIGHAELGLDLAPVLRHFSECLPQDRVIALAEQALGGRWTGSAFICEEEPVHRERDGRHTQEREGANSPAVGDKVHHVIQTILGGKSTEYLEGRTLSGGISDEDQLHLSHL
jgi:hypothetical protein